MGPQGVHEWVTLSDNKIGYLTQRSNAALRGAGRSEKYQHLAFCAAEAVHNCYWYKAGTELTPMAIFLAGPSRRKRLLTAHCTFGDPLARTRRTRRRGSLSTTIARLLDGIVGHRFAMVRATIRWLGS